MATSLLDEDDCAFEPASELFIKVVCLVEEGVVLDRACAAGEAEACARAFESKAAARAAWLALDGEPPPALPDVRFGGMLSYVSLRINVERLNDGMKWMVGARCKAAEHAYGVEV